MVHSRRARAALLAAATFLSISVAGNAFAQKAPARKSAPTTNKPGGDVATDPPKREEQHDDDPNTEDTKAVYLTADLGFALPNIGAFSNKLAFDKTTSDGFLAGLGVGYRHKAFRGGFRFRATDTGQYTLWAMMGEIGWGLPLKPITPVILIHAGYMFNTNVERSAIASYLPSTNQLTPDISLNGLVLGGEIYGAYAVTKFFKVGPFIGFDLTFLHRAQPDLPQSTQPLGPETTQNALFGDSGHGVGFIFNVGLRVTGDVGF